MRGNQRSPTPGRWAPTRRRPHLLLTSVSAHQCVWPRRGPTPHQSARSRDRFRSCVRRDADARGGGGRPSSAVAPELNWGRGTLPACNRTPRASRTRIWPPPRLTLRGEQPTGPPLHAPPIGIARRATRPATAAAYGRRGSRPRHVTTPHHANPRLAFNRIGPTRRCWLLQF